MVKRPSPPAELQAHGAVTKFFGSRQKECRQSVTPTPSRRRNRASIASRTTGRDEVGAMIRVVPATNQHPGRRRHLDIHESLATLGAWLSWDVPFPRGTVLGKSDERYAAPYSRGTVFPYSNHGPAVSLLRASVLFADSRRMKKRPRAKSTQSTEPDGSCGRFNTPSHCFAAISVGTRRCQAAASSMIRPKIQRGPGGHPTIRSNAIGAPKIAGNLSPSVGCPKKSTVFRRIGTHDFLANRSSGDRERSIQPQPARVTARCGSPPAGTRSAWHRRSRP